MKNRKLFPNQTTDCSGFCDPACPYNCYPYPDYYYISPPPPPPSPPLSDQGSYNLSPYMIVLVSVLSSLFLLVGYYVVIVKSCFGVCCSRNNNNNYRLPTQGDQGSDEEFMDENRVDHHHHPIWFITTVGLHQSIINSITVCKYSKGEGLIEGTECSVCLNEFQEGETVRLLPKCSHAFHISCIDTWLRAHTNCPLCRAHIVFDPVRAPPTTDHQTQNPVDVMNPVVDSGVESNSGFGNEELSRQSQGRNVEEGASELTEAEAVAKEMQRIKRCVSMDSSMGAGLFANPHSSMVEKQDGGNSSIADQHLHLSPVPMKRSVSCGGRFFSSKRCRSMN